ncbi:MAG: hypothetical protein ACE5GY_03210 [Thermodesulfobacteriota bacterium]
MSDECPYLDAGRIIKLCKASDTLLMPSTERHKRYCSSDEHYRCPVLLGHVLRSGKEAARRNPGVNCSSWARK